jgi:hypothetical protein
MRQGRQQGLGIAVIMGSAWEGRAGGAVGLSSTERAARRDVALEDDEDDEDKDKNRR